MPKDLNREMYDLDVQSYTDSPRDGVLATIGGKFSTSAVKSRNDRAYTPDLWRSVITSERVREMLETKTFYGELSHPPRAAEFLSEVQMANISHNITKLEFDEPTQDLMGVIDILDTPSGRIANTLLKYGSKIGISSRGIVMDDGKYNSGANEMNPENYYLVTFDLVALPGIMGARLAPMTEAVMPKYNTQLVLESLSQFKDTIEKAKENHDEEALAVLETLEKSIQSSQDMKADPEVQKAIKELSKREDAVKEEPEPEAPKDLEVDADVVDEDKIDAAILEEVKETEAPVVSFRDQKEKFNPTEEGTYDLATGEPVSFDSGYQVSFESPDADFSGDKYEYAVRSLKGKTGSEAFLGFFAGNKEISFHVEDIKMSIEVAKQFNQESIWDWKNSTLIEKADYDNILAGLEPVVESKLVVKKSKKVKPAKEDDGGAVNADAPEGANGATQAKDIQGPKSTINMIGNPKDKKVQKFLESFEGINTIDDVIKYIESLDGVDKTPNGKVIINKDTALFNTMLTMINSLRLRSDANPLVKQGTSIKNAKDLDVEVNEPVNDEYKQDEQKMEPIKKEIKPVPEKNSSLEAALKMVKSYARKIEKLQNETLQMKNENFVLLHDNDLLKEKLKENYTSFNETLFNKDKTIKELSVKVSEADKTSKRAATESLTQASSYKALESDNQVLKTNLYSAERTNQVLQDKFDKLSGKVTESRKDNKIRKLMEAKSITIQSLEDDEAIRTASENADTPINNLDISDAQRLERIVSKSITTKK